MSRDGSIGIRTSLSRLLLSKLHEIEAQAKGEQFQGGTVLVLFQYQISEEIILSVRSTLERYTQGERLHQGEFFLCH